MAWSYKPHQRDQKRWDETTSVTVSDVQRETGFENIRPSSPKR